MADWFKIKNDMLASKGMQFAISEQPLVTSVWLVILSEASKNRSSSFSWSDSDFELIGFARFVNCSVPVFNQSLTLLERIGYIKRVDNKIQIQGWDDIQSDYARGLDKGYYKKTSKKLASDSEVSTVRGEERREDNKERDREEDLPECPPMSRKDFDALVSMRAISLDCAEWFWNTHDARNWLDSKGQPIRKVEPLLINAQKNWRANESKSAANASSLPAGASGASRQGGQTIWQLTKVKEAKEAQAKAIYDKFASPGPLSTSWSSEKQREIYKTLKKEIRDITDRIAKA